MGNFPEREQEFQDALDQTSDQDTFIFDTTGTRIDPLDQSVTETASSDYVRSTLYGEDPQGNNVQLSVDSQGEINVTFVDDDIGILDSNENEIDPLDQSALQTNASDEMRSLVIGLDVDDNDQVVTAENLDTAVSSTEAGLVTYGDRALSSVGEDAVLIDSSSDTAVRDVNIEDRTAQSVTVADSAIIAGGVSQQLGDNDSFTLYLRNENTNQNIDDLTIELSPDGGTDYFEIPESPVELQSEEEDVIKISYDTDNIQLTASASANTTAKIREIR